MDIVHRFGQNVDVIYDDHFSMNAMGIIYKEPALVVIRLPYHFTKGSYYTDIFRELTLINKVNNHLRIK